MRLASSVVRVSCVNSPTATECVPSSRRLSQAFERAAGLTRQPHHNRHVFPGRLIVQQPDAHRRRRPCRTAAATADGDTPRGRSSSWSTVSAILGWSSSTYQSTSTTPGVCSKMPSLAVRARYDGPGRARRLRPRASAARAGPAAPRRPGSSRRSARRSAARRSPHPLGDLVALLARARPYGAGSPGGPPGAAPRRRK